MVIRLYPHEARAIMARYKNSPLLNSGKGEDAAARAGFRDALNAIGVDHSYHDNKLFVFASLPEPKKSFWQKLKEKML